MQIHGYLSDKNSILVQQSAMEAMVSGPGCLILDFAFCKVVSSPGIVAIIKLGIEVSENYQGQVIVCNLDALKERVFDLAGVFNFVEATTTLEEALKAVRKK